MFYHDGCEDGEYPAVFYGSRCFLLHNSLMRLVQPDTDGADVTIPISEDEYYPAKQIVGWQEIDDYPYPYDLIALHYGWDKAGDVSLWNQALKDLGLADNDKNYETNYPTYNRDKLAGYPRWVQGMECPGCPICEQPMRQVFQLAAEDNLPYEFGDLGIGHILQCRVHKSQFGFVWACG